MSKCKREIKQRAIKASAKYLQLRGWDIIATSSDEELKPFHIVATDDAGDLVFVRVRAFTHPPREGDSVNVDGELRTRMEDRFCHFLYDHPEHVDVHVRGDIVDVFVIGGDRALVRHQLNCISYVG